MSRIEEGCRRAALVLASLGPELAAEIFLRLEPREVDLILAEMTRLGTPKSAEISRTLSSFTRQMRSSIEGDSGTETGIRSRLQTGGDSRSDALPVPDEGAPSQSPVQDRIVASLCNADPASFALSLASLEPEEAVLIMYSLPAEIRSDMARRIVARDLASWDHGSEAPLPQGSSAPCSQKADDPEVVLQGASGSAEVSGTAGIQDISIPSAPSEANQSSGLVELLKNLRREEDSQAPDPGEPARRFEQPSL
jgi:hypothetical protein